MTEELLKNQVACGGIREELGNEAKSMFGCTPSNDAYGQTEASLIFKNGDPVSYTHLDVYKRQQQGASSFECQKMHLQNEFYKCHLHC